jgi:oligopeptide transport system substrate-binding protein
MPAIRFAIISLVLCSLIAGCRTAASNRFFGHTEPPAENVLRYIAGPEPETLDPQLPDGQPEARVFMALYEGLVEYHPKDLQPIPAIAKSWEISPNVDQFIFHLRNDAKWSDGTPITARDFVYSFRRGFDPKTISRTAGLGFAVKYSEEFKGNRVFVKKDGEFLLASDEAKATEAFGPETEFHKFITSPDRLTLSGDEKKRSEALAKNPKLAAKVEGAEFVPVAAEDIGVEAIDDYTLRISLKQSAPYFLGLLAHQFFRLVPQHVVEKHGKDWTRPQNIVTNGPFRIRELRPYDALIVEKDPNYWDAANVHLAGIEFYPVEEITTMLNLYKAGSVDAILNHSVPSSWIGEVRQFKDEYMNLPENSTAYYSMNMTKPPFDDLRVRRAFTLGVDREALSDFRKTTKPLYDLTPAGIFPEYDAARQRLGSTRYGFDPEKARALLTEAGFPVEKTATGYSCPKFPTDRVSITFNTNENNRAVGEFVQAQWKQHLGITVPLKTMEFKAYLPFFKALEYEGFALFLWSGDYMDPYTFLSLHYGEENEGASGFYEEQYDTMLDEANAELDATKRYEKLAAAEALLIEKMPIVPLTIAATNWIKKPYVKGLYPNPGTLLPWKFVYLERDPAKWDTNVENIMTARDERVEKQLADLRATQK